MNVSCLGKSNVFCFDAISDIVICDSNGHGMHVIGSLRPTSQSTIKLGIASVARRDSLTFKNDDDIPSAALEKCFDMAFVWSCVFLLSLWLEQ